MTQGCWITAWMVSECFYSEVSGSCMAPSITADDMQPFYLAGWTDEAIYSAISVCALLNL